MKELVNKRACSFVALLCGCLIAVSLSSCQDPIEMVKKRASNQNADADSKKQEMPKAVPAAPVQKPDQDNSKKSIINKTTAVVLDAKKALKNPDITVVDGKIKGLDPFTQAGSAYISMASRVSTLGMQQSIKSHKALNDRFPTYDEYMKMMKENRIEFAKLPPYKMYGYDDETGHILVLQDNKKKAELYKAAGIPLD